jgi:CRISPR-associated protein Cmr5
MEEVFTLRNSIEQLRFKSAYNDAQDGISKVGQDEYSSFVNELPMLIKVNGLGAAIAYASYKNEASKLVNAQLTKWLNEETNLHLLGKISDRLDFALLKCDSTTYKSVTRELLAYITWLRRFAKALAVKNG